MKKRSFFAGVCFMLVFFASNAYAEVDLQLLAREGLVTTFEALEMMDNDAELFELASSILPNSDGLASISDINDLEISPEEKADELIRTAVLGFSCDEWLTITVVAFVIDYFINVPYSLFFLIWLLCYLGVL